MIDEYDGMGTMECGRCGRYIKSPNNPYRTLRAIESLCTTCHMVRILTTTKEIINAQ